MSVLHDMTVLPRRSIVVDPVQNARRTIYKQPLVELAGSIERHGLLHPVGVRVHPNAGSGGIPADAHLLVWGYRRIAAIDMIDPEQRGLVNVVVVNADEAAAHDMMLEENIHREDVAPWDLGGAVKIMLDKGFSLPDIGKRLSLITGHSHKLARLHALAMAVEGLHPDLLTLWQRGSEYLNEKKIFELSRLPWDLQQEAIEQIVGGSIDIDDGPRVRPPGGAESGPSGKKKKLGKRPPPRAIAVAYQSLKQHEDDEHSDGLSNEDERRGARKVLEWILGGRSRCPIVLRKHSKHRSVRAANDDGETS